MTIKHLPLNGSGGFKDEFYLGRLLMKNGFTQLSVALLVTPIHFGLFSSFSNLHGQQEAAPPAPDYFESSTDTDQAASPATLPNSSFHIIWSIVV